MFHAWKASKKLHSGNLDAIALAESGWMYLENFMSRNYLKVPGMEDIVIDRERSDENQGRHRREVSAPSSHPPQAQTLTFWGKDANIFLQLIAWGYPTPGRQGVMTEAGESPALYRNCKSERQVRKPPSGKPNNTFSD